ncbi:MAG TPA: efflux RND transporter periplasmic adaptor subunit [Pyrinomonadaceae bacterium]|jgi:multidrug efflux pump subunit AcrA (membrane-fusion protein)|nr:efflux RND transporter periplasmic adaptor subunit [Pyrinomonadaceae bacterium]
MDLANTYRPLFLALILLATTTTLIGCGGSRAESKNKNAAAQATPAPEVIDVSTAQAISRQLPTFIETTGSLAADEQTDVAPLIGGRVTAVNFDLGSYVQKGAVMVRLDNRDAQLRLEQAESQLQQAEAAVKQAEERIGLRPGQRFEVTRVAEVGAAKAALDLAEKQLIRYEKLIESGDVSRSAYDQQRAQRDQLRQQYEAALAQAQQSYAGVGAARAARETAAVAVQQARKGLTDVVVNAPISGYVAERTADPGEYVSTASKIATVVRTNPMRVRIDVPEQAISDVRNGQGVTVSLSSYADRSFAGRVTRISPNITDASRTLTVEAQIDNGEGLLKPGQFATVRILQPRTEPAVLIPQRAVRTEGTESRVFAVKNGRAELRLVQIGQTEGDLVQVKGGLAADETVATSNLDKLQDGSPVRQ